MCLEKLKRNKKLLLKKKEELEKKIGENPGLSKVMKIMLLSDICQLLESWEKNMDHNLNFTQISEIYSSLEI